jgi:hypothetical protein
LSKWPPGFPVLIAASHWVTGSSIESTARLVNIALAGVIAALTWLLARRHLGELWALAITLAVLLPATGLTWITIEAWSEPLATALLLGTVLLLEKSWSDNGMRWGVVVGAALLAAAGGLTRYSGVFIVAGGTLSLLLMRAPPSRQRLRAAALFSALASAPIILWLFHVWRMTGSPTGPRVARGTTPDQIVRQLASTVGGWVLPGVDTPGPTQWVGLAVLGLGGALALVFGYRSFRSARSARSARPAPGISSPGPLAWVTVVSAVGVLAASAVVHFDPIGPRLLAPVLPGGLVLIGLAVAAVAAVAAVDCNRVPRSVLAVAGVAVALWGGYAVRSTMRSPRLGQVVSYTSPVWVGPTDAALAEVAQVSPNARLWSDAPDAIWVARHRAARSTPERVRSFAAHSPARQVQAFRDAVAESGPNFIVWIDQLRVPYLYSPDQLATVVRLQLVATGDHWSVYETRPPGH